MGKILDIVKKVPHEEVKVLASDAAKGLEEGLENCNAAAVVQAYEDLVEVLTDLLPRERYEIINEIEREVTKKLKRCMMKGV